MMANPDLLSETTRLVDLIGRLRERFSSHDEGDIISLLELIGILRDAFFTQTEMAELFGRDRSMISRYEGDNTKISFGYLACLAMFCVEDIASRVGGDHEVDLYLEEVMQSVKDDLLAILNQAIADYTYLFPGQRLIRNWDEVEDIAEQTIGQKRHTALSVLKRLRINAQISLEQMAAYFGVAVQDVEWWEIGTGTPAEEEHRLSFISYLSDQLGLHRNLTQLRQVWTDVMVGEWDWKPLGDELKLSTLLPSVIVPRQLAHPPADFVGRTFELSQLKTASENSIVTMLGIWGMGGIGKTVLALKLAEMLGSDYPDAQLALDLQGTSLQPVSAIDAMVHVIRSFYREARIPEDESALAGLYRSVLYRKRALLLMDNAANADHIAPLIPPSTCILLVTSRQHFALPGLYAITVDTLPEPDARNLLLTIAPRIGDQSNTIAKYCGYLPLALRLAAGTLLTHVDVSPQVYVRRLTESQDRIKFLDSSFSTNPQTLGIEASLALSDELLSPEVQKLWRSLTVFADGFDVPAAAAVWEIDLDQAHDILSALLARSLLEWNQVSKRYRLHDLVQLYVRRRLDETERTASQRRHAVHYLDRLREANELFQQGGQAFEEALKQFDADWKNIQAGQAWAETHAGTNDTALRLCNDYPRVGGALLSLRQHPRDRLRWIQAALAAARTLEHREAENQHLSSLGNTLSVLGESHQAIELCKQALAIAREIGDRHGECQALDALGRNYQLVGQSGHAVTISEQTREIARELGDRRTEALVLLTLGNAYHGFGRANQMLKYYEQALGIFSQIGDRQFEGRARIGVGLAYAELGEHHRSLEFNEQALVIAREIADRASAGRALGNISLAYSALGYHSQAIEVYKERFAIAQEVGDLLGESNVLSNMGEAYAATKDFRQAIELYKQALRIKRKTGERRGEANVLGNMGFAYSELGQHQRARKLFQRQLALARKIKHRRGEGWALWGLSHLLHKLGRLDPAIRLAENARDIFDEIHHPNAAKVRELLALIETEQAASS